MMKHLDYYPTPLSKLNHISKIYGCNVMTKRDDLFTEAGGGNKARML